MIRRLRIKFVCINMCMVTLMLVLIIGSVTYFILTGVDRELSSAMQSTLEQFVEPETTGNLNWYGGSYLVLNLNPMNQMNGVMSTNLTDPSSLGEPEELIFLAMNDGRESGILEQVNLRFCRVVKFGQTYLMFADRSAEEAVEETIFQRSALIGGTSFLLFLGISLLLARWAVAPVDRAWKQQRQFVADASHELKTPLTVILTNAELLRDAAYTEGDKRRFSDSILTMSRQMRGLIENLLELARVDGGIPPGARTQVDWSKLVLDQALVMEPLCFEQGLELETRIDDGILVLGSPGHLAQLPEILLDNARKYSAPGGKIVLRLVRSGSRHCLLSVSNPGQPIPPEVRRHLFERFYRADSARSRDGSYGLGLAIAQTIVANHRGKIWAESAGGQNTFLIRLPLCPARPRRRLLRSPEQSS